MNWSNSRVRVDKHSTGGIGDKISIVLVPLLAAAGVDVPDDFRSGAWGHGGTLDKLESIHGFHCECTPDEFRFIVNDCGCAIVSASDRLAVADRKLYALRDVTGTVPSIPLITASILSKKLAAGLSGLVLDVKWGSGAFMKTLDDARTLAKSLVDVANGCGVPTTALITDMNQPLGRQVGNANEIQEAIDVLNGEGPDDVIELTLALGAELLVATAICKDLGQAQKKLNDCLKHGDALKKFEQMVDAQQGDLARKREIGFAHPVHAAESGYINRINAERIGLAVVEMEAVVNKLETRLTSVSALNYSQEWGTK